MGGKGREGKGKKMKKWGGREGEGCVVAFWGGDGRPCVLMQLPSCAAQACMPACLQFRDFARAPIRCRLG